MRILLVNPAIRPDSPKCILNVGLGYVGTALLDAGHELAVLDIDAHRYDAQTVEKLIRKATFDAVGVGTLVSQYRWAKWLASLIRQHHPHVPIVAGNTLATSIPDHLLTNTEFDVAVLGEGEVTACELFQALEEGGEPGDIPGLAWRNGDTVERTPVRPVIKDIDTVPLPDYEALFDIDIYLERSKWMVPAPETLPVPFEEIISFPVSTARGCPFSCSFCLSPETPVLMNDMTWRPIAELVPGDLVLAFDEEGSKDWTFGAHLGKPSAARRYRTAVVTGSWGTMRDAYRLTLSDGSEIVCSGDHKWLTVRAEWMETRRMVPGSRIRKLAETWDNHEQTDEYLVGYLAGAHIGDGTMRFLSYTDEGKRLRPFWRVASTDPEMMDRVAKAATLVLGEEPRRRIFRHEDERGRQMTSVATQKKDGVVAISEAVYPQSDLREHPEWRRGFVAGFFDAEGSCSNNVARMSQKVHPWAFDLVEKILGEHGVSYVRKRWASSGKQEVRIVGGKRMQLKFFGIFRPAITRKWPKFVGKSIGAESLTVIKKEAIGTQALWDIETTTGTFIAAGLASHNCFHAFQNLRYRHRSPESVVSEMEHWRDQYGVNYVHFWDELSLYQDKTTERLADLIIERAPGIAFFASCRSELLNEENAHIAHKLKQAGCKGLGFSLESGSEEILQAMNKRNHVSDFVTQCRVLHKAGIEVYTSLVFGYPQETEETIAETFRVCDEAKVYPSVGYLQPMPGTPMFDLALETGAIEDVEEYLFQMGDRQDLRVNLTSLDQERMERVVHDHLVALNESLNTGLAEKELIKTRSYRVAKEETFLEGFGQAAKVQADAQLRSDMERFTGGMPFKVEEFRRPMFVEADLVPLHDDTPYAFGVIGREGSGLVCTALVAEVDLATGMVTLRLRREGERWGVESEAC